MGRNRPLIALIIITTYCKTKVKGPRSARGRTCSFGERKSSIDFPLGFPQQSKRVSRRSRAQKRSRENFRLKRTNDENEKVKIASNEFTANCDRISGRYCDQCDCALQESSRAEDERRFCNAEIELRHKETKFSADPSLARIARRDDSSCETCLFPYTLCGRDRLNFKQNHSPTPPNAINSQCEVLHLGRQ